MRRSGPAPLPTSAPTQLCPTDRQRRHCPAGTSNQCALIPGVVGGCVPRVRALDDQRSQPRSRRPSTCARSRGLDRAPDPTQRFSSRHPATVTPSRRSCRPIAGDPVVIRNIHVGQGTQHADDRRPPDLLGAALPRRRRGRVEPDRHDPHGRFGEVHPGPAGRCRRAEPRARRLPLPRRREPSIRGRRVGPPPRAPDRRPRHAPTAARLRDTAAPVGRRVPPARRSTTSPSAPSTCRALRPAEATTVERRRSSAPRPAAAVRTRLTFPGTARAARRGGRVHPGDAQERTGDESTSFHVGALLRI